MSRSTPLDRAATASPLVVGALGGSGTRAVHEILSAAGIFMGGTLDRHTGDSIMLRRFFEAHFDTLVHDLACEDPAIARDLDHALHAHRMGIPHPGDDWGWKNPRSMWLLPWLIRRLPGLRFLHVVRDGRDLASSTNAFLRSRHGRQILRDRHTGDPLRDQFALWSMGNRLVAEVGEPQLGSRFLRVRYEDLCANRVDEIERILEFVGRPMPHERVLQLATKITPSPTSGRGMRDPSDAMRACAMEHRETLRLFGYATPDDDGAELSSTSSATPKTARESSP